jgi:transcriptional regulator with XRE-family HTH domain
MDCALQRMSGDMRSRHPFRTWRRHHDLTLAECAQRLGISLAHLSHVESGNRTPSVGLIVRLASITKGAVTQEEILQFTTTAVLDRSA